MESLDATFWHVGAQELRKPNLGPDTLSIRISNEEVFKSKIYLNQNLVRSDRGDILPYVAEAFRCRVHATSARYWSKKPKVSFTAIFIQVFLSILSIPGMAGSTVEELPAEIILHIASCTSTRELEFPIHLLTSS